MEQITSSLKIWELHKIIPLDNFQILPKFINAQNYGICRPIGRGFFLKIMHKKLPCVQYSSLIYVRDMRSMKKK